MITHTDVFGTGGPADFIEHEEGLLCEQCPERQPNQPVDLYLCSEQGCKKLYPAAEFDLPFHTCKTHADAFRAQAKEP